MTPFQPTSGIKDTAQNVKSFVAEHNDTLWDIFKPLAVFIAALTAIDVGIMYFLTEANPETGERTHFEIGGLISAYFFTCLVISWHRLVIHGPQRFEPMQHFQPQKNDWVFIGMGLLLGFGISLLTVIIIVASAAISPIASAIIAIPAVIVATWLFLRLSFYFPSKATGNTITFKQSFILTKGYVWKLIAASFLAAIKLWLIMLAYLILGGILYGILVTTIQIAALQAALTLVYVLPIVLYFQPLLTVISITVLSNYYQHALQNKPPNEGAS